MQTTEQIIEQDRIEELLANGIETAIYELVDRQPSTWIKDGTQNLPVPLRKDAPAARQILNRSAYATNIQKNKAGEIVKYDRVATRHIYGCKSIEVDKQVDDSTAVPNADLDRITFVDGRLIVANEGATKSLFSFTKKDSRNETCECRIPGVDAVYREVFPEKEKENFNEDTMLIGKAITTYIEPLAQKTAKGYVYKEDKINALCRLFAVYAETNGGKIESLLNLAKTFPRDFIERIAIYEESILQEIAAAIQFGVIQFEPNRCVYVSRDEVLVTYSSKLNENQKVIALADFFKSEQGLQKYEIFLAELEFAKKKSLDN